MSTNHDEFPTTAQDGPSIQEKELFGVWSELKEINGNIAKGRPAAIRNTVLSALAAIGGIVGIYKTFEHRGDLANKETIMAGIFTFAGAGGIIRNKRKINRPESLEQEKRVNLLYEREKLLMECIQQNS